MRNSPKTIFDSHYNKSYIERRRNFPRHKPNKIAVLDDKKSHNVIDSAHLMHDKLDLYWLGLRRAACGISQKKCDKENGLKGRNQSYVLKSTLYPLEVIQL